MKIPILTELVNDLRSPPAKFPKFDFDFNYFVDEDGNTYGDVTAYVACRVLGHPNRIPQFLIDGGDIYWLFKKHTGLSGPEAARLVYPGELVNCSRDISRIAGDEMATIVQMFIDNNGVIDYGLILKALAEDSSEKHAERYEPQAISGRVSSVVDYYGDKSKSWPA